jgi:hypothetical protein
VHVQTEVHQPHRGHPQNQPAATRSGDEHSTRPTEMAGQHRHLLHIDLGSRRRNLVPDKGQVGGNILPSDRRSKCRRTGRTSCLWHSASFESTVRPVAAGRLLSG